MLTLLPLVLQMVLGVALTSAVLRRDMRRLPPLRHRRAWNGASFWSAVVGFGPLCIPVHFVRTRRSVSGLGLGVAWLAAVLTVLSLVAELTERGLLAP